MTSYLIVKKKIVETRGTLNRDGSTSWKICDAEIRIDPPVALPITIVEHSLRIKIVNHQQVEVPTWMTLESGMMVMGRYCAAFTDMGRVTCIYFLFYPSRIPTMATPMAVAAVTAAAKDEESHVGGRVNRKKNNSVSNSGSVRVSFFLLCSRFSLAIPFA